MLPAQNTSGNWVKVVQRVPMRVRVDTSDKNNAAAARRHERRSRCRHRPRARLSALLDVLFGRRVVSRRSRRRQRRQSRGDHRLRDPRHADAGARHHHRQCRAALHARQRLGEPGPDRLGADLLHRRRRDHDAADRLSRRPLRPQAPVPRLDRRLHRGVDAVRHGAVPDADRAVPRPARRVRRGVGAAVADRAARHLSARAPGLRHGAVRHRRDGRARPRPGARRLADRELQLALCLLHQPADRHSRADRHHRLSCRRPRATPIRSSIGSASAL